MKKPLKRVKRKLYYYNSKGKRILGKNENMSGDCSDLRGDCSNLYGDCSRLIGDCSEIPMNKRPCNINEWVE